MLVENYFDFLAPDDIRIKGSRVGIENVLLDYLHRNLRPEQIAERYPSLSLEQVYATILYYLHDRPTVEAYLTDFLSWQRQVREAQSRAHSAAAKGVLQVKEELAKYSVDERPEALRRLAGSNMQIESVEVAEVA
jgi:uncharacterized protein (DUF433 family)